MKSNLLLVLVALVMLVVAACAGEEATPTPTPAPASGTPTPTPASGPTITDVVVSARYAAFQPATITVAKGETISLQVTSTDSPHTFTIDELGINVSVGGGNTVTREITIDQAGTFTFYCSVPGHRGAGMEGTLTVIE